MIKKAYEDLRPVQQADVSMLADGTIREMIKHQFSDRHMAAFVELIQERIGNLYPVTLDQACRGRGQSETGPQQSNINVPDGPADDQEN